MPWVRSSVVGPDSVPIEFVIDAHAHDTVRDAGIEIDSNGRAVATIDAFRAREPDLDIPRSVDVLPAR